MLENEIKNTLAADEIELPEIVKLLLDLKTEFNLNETSADDVLRTLKLDNDQAVKERDYLYKRLVEYTKKCNNCMLCTLETHTQKVPGEGALNSPLVLIGEGPGFDEDKEGRPFVGKAGKLLTTILDKLNINREKVYITNVIKCRPPQNRTPLQKEIKACSHILELELSIIQPKAIIALGAVPFNYFKPGSSIMKERGQWVNVRDYWIMPTFHPAYILRQGGKVLTQVKWLVWGDFNKALEKAKEFCPEYNYTDP